MVGTTSNAGNGLLLEEFPWETTQEKSKNHCR